MLDGLVAAGYMFTCRWQNEFDRRAVSNAGHAAVALGVGVVRSRTMARGLKASLATAKSALEAIKREPTASAAHKERIISQLEVAKNFYVAPSREGKLHISAWLDPSYKARIRAIQMNHPEKSLQDLYAEALNDLFRKYGIAQPRPQGAKGRVKA